MEISSMKLILFSLLAVCCLELVRGQCGPPGAIRCTTCDATQLNCLSCPARTQLKVDATPVACVSCFDNCLTCNRSDSPCILCRPGNGPDSANMGKCAACDTNHCQAKCQINGAGKCDFCEDGYGLTPAFVCATCPDNCKTCGAVNTSYCDVCMPGWTTVLGACQKCAPNCTKCDTAGEGKCDDCAPGFTLQLPAKTCTQCAPNCAKCDTAGPGKCDPGGCALGFGPDASGICKECAPNCTNCTIAGAGKCDPNGCPAGLAPDANGMCAATTPKPPSTASMMPTTMAQASSSSGQGGSTTPSGQGGSTTPGGQGGSTTPGGQGGSTTPDGAGGSTTPGGQGGSTTPGGQGGSSTPGGQGGSTTPGGQGGSTGGNGGGDDGLNGGKLIGLIIGVVSGLLLLVLIILCCWVSWPNVWDWNGNDNHVVVVSKRGHRAEPVPVLEPAPTNYPWNYRRHVTTIIADNA